MARYGSNSLSILYDDAAGTPRDISTHVLSWNGVNIEALLEESHGFGAAWIKQVATGVSKMDPIDLEMFYDDTALTGTTVVFDATAAGPATATRTLTVNWGGAHVFTVETVFFKKGRSAERGALHKFRATVQPTDAPTTDT